jgi:hypothetical protein
MRSNPPHADSHAFRSIFAILAQLTTTPHNFKQLKTKQYRFYNLVRDQEAGGSNPLAPTNSFNNLQMLARQTAHPVAVAVASLPGLFFCQPIR